MFALIDSFVKNLLKNLIFIQKLLQMFDFNKIFLYYYCPKIYKKFNNFFFIKIIIKIIIFKIL